MDATALYYGTDHEILIEWLDAVGKRFPRTIHVKGKAISLDHGIRLGMPLAELAAINGASIELAGFGWDYSGQHRSFANGQLAYLDKTLQLRYAPDPEVYKKLSDPHDILGEQTLFSTRPAVQNVKPFINVLAFDYPRDVRHRQVQALLEKAAAPLISKSHRDPAPGLGPEQSCKEEQEATKFKIRTCFYEKGTTVWTYAEKEAAEPEVFDYLKAFTTSHLELFGGLETFFQAPRPMLWSIFSQQATGSHLVFDHIDREGLRIRIDFEGEKAKEITFSGKFD